MARHMRLDDQDKAALRALDNDFVITPDGEVATVEGEMEITVIRPADDRFQLTIKFPGGELFDVKILRLQLLRELNIEADES